jgi:hypothetical protein
MARVRDNSMGGAKDTTGMAPDVAMKYMKVKEKQMEQPMDIRGSASSRRDRIMYTSTARALRRTSGMGRECVWVHTVAARNRRRAQPSTLPPSFPLSEPGTA